VAARPRRTYHGIVRLPAFIGVALLGGAAGCAVRSAPYRFTSPLVGAVSAAPLDGRRSDSGSESGSGSDSGHVRDHGLEPPHPRDARAIAKRTRLDLRPLAKAAAPPARDTTASEVLTGDGASGDDLAVALRTMVGAHDDTSTDIDFVLAALGHLGAAPDGALADARDHASLLALAHERDAVTSDRPRLGDLLVFSELVAIVVSVDDRDVIEFVYLARGVVRRGFACPRDPGTRRDAAGRVLNTIIRHSDGGLPRGAPTRAGQLLTATISLAHLLSR
jgi:hypothetical protein